MKKYQVIKLLEKYQDSDNVDFESLWDSLDIQSLISMWYISKTKHPTLPLYIYNYTDKCQYEKKWNDITITHRWLIKDEEWNIIARSFNKIFNYSELDWKRKRDILEDHTLYVREKLDWSLLIVFFYNWQWITATRWSFISEQSIKWKEILEYKWYFEYMDKSLTYLYEVIYPENKIVVDYWNKEDCILLAVTDKKWVYSPLTEHIPVAKEYGVYDIDSIQEMREKWLSWKEWFVCWSWSKLFKVKFDEYIELHKRRFSYNKDDIFNLIKQWVKDFSNIPDEYHEEIRHMIQYYKSEYSKIRKECVSLTKQYNWDRTIYIWHKYSSILYAWIDFKDISPMINNLIVL